ERGAGPPAAAADRRRRADPGAVRRRGGAMSLRLSELLNGVIDIDARIDRDIAELSLDSKTLVPGAAFIALRGTQRHGIEFAAEAVARGAAIVLAEAP